MRNTNPGENEADSRVKLPESLSPFDVEIVAEKPLLRVYILTYEETEWEQAKKVVASLKGQISPFSFIEYDDSEQLQGVFAQNLERVLRGKVVESIRDYAIRLQNTRGEI